jgi:hypothetical protein
MASGFPLLLLQEVTPAAVEVQGEGGRGQECHRIELRPLTEWITQSNRGFWWMTSKPDLGDDLRIAEDSESLSNLES